MKTTTTTEGDVVGSPPSSSLSPPQMRRMIKSSSIMSPQPQQPDPSTSPPPPSYQAQCTCCSFFSDYDTVFRHGVESHQIYICVCCSTHYSMAKELMVHLYREHRVPPQRYRSEVDFIQAGGSETVLCCVDCSSIFEVGNGEDQDASSSCDNHTHGVQQQQQVIGGTPAVGLKSIENNQIIHDHQNQNQRKKKVVEKAAVASKVVVVEQEEDNTVTVTPVVRSGGGGMIDRPRRILRKVTNDDFIFESVTKRRSYQRQGSLASAPTSITPIPRPRQRNSFSGTGGRVDITPVNRNHYNNISNSTGGGGGRKFNGVSSSLIKIENDNGQNSSLHQQQSPRLPHLRIKFENGYKSYTPNHNDSYDQDEDEEEEEEEDEPQEEVEVKLDPLLLESDPSKRLLMLIEELDDKLGTGSWPSGPDSLGFTCQKDDDSVYELIVNSISSSTSSSSSSSQHPLEDRLDEDAILTQMLRKTALNCTYCRQVKLIRIDKRQLAVHLFSNHCWKVKMSVQNPKHEEKEEEKRSEELESDQVDSVKIIIKSPVQQVEKETIPRESSPPSSVEKMDVDEDEEELLAVIPPTNTTTTTPPVPPQSLSPLPSVTTEKDEKSLNNPTDVKEEKEEEMTKEVNNETTSAQEKIISVPATPQVEDQEALPRLPSPEPMDTTDSSNNNKLPVDEEENKESSSASKETQILEIKEEEKEEEASSKVVVSPIITPIPTQDMSTTIKIDWSEFKHAVLKKVFLSSSVLFSYKDCDDMAAPFGFAPCECLLCGYFVESQQNLFLHWRKIHKGVAMKCAMCQGRFLFAGALYSHLCFGTPNPVIKNEVEPHQQNNGNNNNNTNNNSNNKSLTPTTAHGFGGKFPSYNSHHHHHHNNNSNNNSLVDGGDFTVLDAKDDDGSADTIVLRYQCNICENVQLPGFFNYMVHLRKVHNRCELCLEEMETQRELEHHMKKHKLNHFCWKCGVTYCAKPNFMTHLFWKHGSESKECSICLKKKWPHIYHFCVPPSVFACETCGFYFTKPKYLVVHRRLHTGEKLRTCSAIGCNEKFISRKLLDKHVESVHSGDNRDLNILPPITLVLSLSQSQSQEKEEEDEKMDEEEEDDDVKLKPEELSLSPNNQQKSEEKEDEKMDEDKEEDVKPELSSPSSKLSTLLEPEKQQQEEEPQKDDKEMKEEEEKENEKDEKKTEDEKDDEKDDKQQPQVVSVSPPPPPQQKEQELKDVKEMEESETAKAEISPAPLSPASENSKKTEEEPVAVKTTVVAVTHDLDLSDESSDDEDNENSSPKKSKVVEKSVEKEKEELPSTSSSSSEQQPACPPTDNVVLEENLEKRETSLQIPAPLLPVPQPQQEPEKDESSSTAQQVDPQQQTKDDVDEETKPVEVPAPTPEMTTENNDDKEQVLKVVTHDLDLSDESSDSSSSSSSSDSEDDDNSDGSKGGEDKDVEPVSAMTNILDHCENLEKNLNQSAMDIDDSLLGKSLKVTTLALDLNVEMDLMEGVEKMKDTEGFGSMSPLLTPLDDFNFSVPDIPTFEDNSLPEHIIRENAIFSLQNEHDYCLRLSSVKRGPSGTSLIISPISASSCSRSSSGKGGGESRHKKLKGHKNKSPRKRAHSSSSSSSSSSSCGSNCSCSSSSSSGSSSSSSDGSSSEDESPLHLKENNNNHHNNHNHHSHYPPKNKVGRPRIHPVKIPRYHNYSYNNSPPRPSFPSSVTGQVSSSGGGPPVKRGRGRPKGSINRNKDGVPTAKKKAPIGGAGKRIGRIIVPKPPRPLNPDGSPMKRKYRKQKGKFSRKSSTAQYEKENDDGIGGGGRDGFQGSPIPEENYLLETDLETEESGSEEIYDKKQSTEMIGGKVPNFNEIWTMSNEQYLLKLVRGVKDLEELRNPLPFEPTRLKIKMKRQKHYGHHNQKQQFSSSFTTSSLSSSSHSQVSTSSYSLQQQHQQQQQFSQHINNPHMTYSVQQVGVTSESRLNVRNVPIKPLIFKRNYPLT